MEKSVGLILFRVTGKGELFLLLHYRSGHWDFPKGHVEEGETEHQTAIRELHEETGIAGAEITAGFRDRVEYSFRRGGKVVSKEVIYYLARTSTPAVRLSREHRGCAWLTAAAALARLTHENSRRLLNAAIEALKKEDRTDRA